MIKTKGNFFFLKRKNQVIKMEKKSENLSAGEKLANKTEKINFNQKVCYPLVYAYIF